MRYIILLCGLLLFSTVAQAESFQSWLADYKARAVQAGIPAQAVNYALQDVQLDESLIDQDRSQPETQQTMQEYMDKTLTEKRVETGREKMDEYSGKLARVERVSGVPREILVALWGKETDYGGFTGHTETINALATMAYEGRRRHFFEQELLAAIVMLNRLGWQPDRMTGSWAGAVGQCQFMPSNYAKYGIDGDGDGKVDLWNSMDDVFFSMANMLKQQGWEPGASWGQRVRLPPGFDNSLLGRDKTPYDLHFWEQRGVRFTKTVPAQTASAIRIYQPDGPSTAAYALYPNYDVLIAWNHSGYFATTVGVLADNISSD
jgi:membrane-bound lytic murein transglycosylase B